VILLMARGFVRRRNCGIERTIGDLICAYFAPAEVQAGVLQREQRFELFG
jgi:hypothetical protein